MRISLALAVVASLGLFACAGSHQEAKDADDAAVWANFKGTYSQPAEPASREKAVAKKEAAPAAAPESEKSAKAAPAEKTEEPIAAAPPAPAKKSSKGTIKGESLSTITVDALSDGATSLTKSKLVSNGVITGSNYEVVTVQTKKATIKITRPSAGGTGPQLADPQSKITGLEKTDAYWYDADADVLVVVTGTAKKGAATKTLNAIVKH